MTTMLENVLEFGRAETGRLEFAPSRLDLRGLCEDLIAEHARAQQGHDGPQCELTPSPGPPVQ